MKVAYFTDTYLSHNNGIATSLYSVHCADKEWEDHVFCPIDFPEVERVSGIPFLFFPEYKLALNRGWLKKYAKEFDIIHNHTPYGMFYYGAKAAKAFDKPLVGTFHTDPAAVFGSMLPVECPPGRIMNKLTWKYLIKLYDRCDVVIAVSPWLKEFLEGKGMKRPVVSIPNGIDTSRFSPDVDKGEFRKVFRIPRGKPIVLFMGRLQHKKDPKTFLRAALKSKSDAVFVIAGKGELESDLRKMAQGKDNIIFAGYLSEKLVSKAYSAADIFVLPSEMETQGLVLIEALASETPCISTDVGIAKDVVEGSLMFEHRNSEQLAQRIDSLLEDKKLRKRLGKKGRKKVERDYSINSMVKNLGTLYETLTDGKK
jgi:glycosyltransferase involved in cell wall biosynthesis